MTEGLPFPTIPLALPVTADGVYELREWGWHATVCPVCRDSSANVMASASHPVYYYLCATCQGYALTHRALAMVKGLEDHERTKVSQYTLLATQPPTLTDDDIYRIGTLGES
jgi:hypothetical protein